MNNPYIDADDTKVWKNKEGQLHREDGPAVEYKNGTQVWYNDNQFHRDNGPAMIWMDSGILFFKKWYFKGKNIE